MLIAMYYHMFPPAAEKPQMRCTCAVHPRPVAA